MLVCDWSGPREGTQISGPSEDFHSSIAPDYSEHDLDDGFEDYDDAALSALPSEGHINVDTDDNRERLDGLDILLPEDYQHVAPLSPHSDDGWASDAASSAACSETSSELSESHQDSNSASDELQDTSSDCDADDHEDSMDKEEHAGRVPHLRDLHIRPGVKLWEGRKVPLNAKAEGGAFYPFPNYTSLALFIWIFKHQISAAAFQDLCTILTTQLQAPTTGGQRQTQHGDPVGNASSHESFNVADLPQTESQRTKFMATTRTYLPLGHVVATTVKTAVKAGQDPSDRSTTTALHTPINVLLQQLLLSKEGVQSVVECKDSHTMTSAQCAASRLDTAHLTAVPTELLDERMRSAANGQRSRRSVFHAVEHVRAGDGKLAYIGDIVRASVVSEDGTVASMWSRLRAFHWSVARRCMLVTVSPLISGADAGDAALAKAKESPLDFGPKADYRRGQAYFECISRSGECVVTVTALQSVSIEAVTTSTHSAAPSLVGFVLPVAGKPDCLWEWVPAFKRPGYFNMRAMDNNLNSTNLPVVKLSLETMSDKFQCYGIGGANCSLSATYVVPRNLDSSMARLTQHTIVGGVLAPDIPWQTDFGLHFGAELRQLERGVIADLLYRGAIIQVSHEPTV